MGKIVGIGWSILLLCLPLVISVGYAPVTIIGTVVDQGTPVEATVSLHSFVQGELFGESDEVATKDGVFAASVSVPDPASADVQVFITVADKQYVEIVENASSWGKYSLTFDIADESLGVPAPASVVSLPGAGFEQDLDAIRNGSPNASVLQAYNITKADRPTLPSPPVQENPMYLPAPAEHEQFFRQYWGVFAIIMAVICFFIIRHEVKRKH